MKRSYFLGVSFIFTVSILLLIIIFNLNQNNKELIVEKKGIVQEEIENSNIIKDVEYKSKDSSGNEYTLKSSEGIIDQNNTNIIYLTSIKASIDLKDYDYINISSKFGKYNIDNFDTIFSKNVIIEYLDNIIIGEYLEFSLSKNLMTISRNVVFKNDKSSLTADVIEVDIKTKDINSPVVELSGGNQQKVVIAKGLVQKPKVVIFDEPTRGVDVGAIKEIHDFIKSLADEGITVIVVSSYLPEVMSISDRILVARLGQIVEEFEIEDASEEKIIYAAVH